MVDVDESYIFGKTAQVNVTMNDRTISLQFVDAEKDILITLPLERLAELRLGLNKNMP